VSEDLYAGYEDIAEIRKQRSRRNRKRAASMFAETQVLASTYNIGLTQRTDAHYQLTCDGWLLDIYPGNQRIYRPPPGGSHPNKAPHLVLPDERDWSLRDVVIAAHATREATP